MYVSKIKNGKKFQNKNQKNNNQNKPQSSKIKKKPNSKFKKDNRPNPQSRKSVSQGSQKQPAKQVGIKEIVKEKKVKKELPLRAKNDPRRKS